MVFKYVANENVNCILFLEGNPALSIGKPAHLLSLCK